MADIIYGKVTEICRLHEHTALTLEFGEVVAVKGAEDTSILVGDCISYTPNANPDNKTPACGLAKLYRRAEHYASLEATII